MMISNTPYPQPKEKILNNACGTHELRPIEGSFSKVIRLCDISSLLRAPGNLKTETSGGGRGV